jgi:hypothetical protein
MSMLPVVLAYIDGCTKEQIEELGKAVIKRQSYLNSIYKQKLEELRNNGITH